MDLMMSLLLLLSFLYRITDLLLYFWYYCEMIFNIDANNCNNKFGSGEQKMKRKDLVIWFLSSMILLCISQIIDSFKYDQGIEMFSNVLRSFGISYIFQY
ncbi:hypothetical protein MG5_06217 [Candida albicans P57072]|uniref:Uncharacterized protein n=2 Tax=Candida albicans TaxID=5476 RepID=C4YMU2_CANAW|nr:predicted protein [Candida albicans WO-1]KGQ80383.1 hypothetical protein MEO_06198 [Candida albicans P94015]KGQ80649.1 hypothetical protein MG1_06269 [Candida albicans GC75]KGQ80836.1 hypothetical protein MEU_06231 [Candida albicans P37005]KGQ99735.1 hypothetical protein MG5_06217 [Candida albicans P57072]KGR00596.1 hypothetical protein MG3_06267 [Candida albicans P78048]KGR05249.1 hypothetical protein MG9_06254 [Candida albicans P37037]KGT62825.1 hypothetical protein MEK_06232 [Candida a